MYLAYVFEGGGNPNDTSPKTSRITRVRADPANPDVALPGSEVIILGSVSVPPCDSYDVTADCMPADSGSHAIGTIKFGRDGKLYVGNGDGARFDIVDPRCLSIPRY